MRVANAHNDPGPEGLKTFNIGYLAGIAGILLAWNGAILFKVAISEQYVPSTARCLKITLGSKPFYPVTIGIVIVSLCFVFSLIIIRRTKIYLSRLQDNHLRNLPAKNVLTYIDTLILFSIISGTCLVKLFSTIIWIFDVMSYENVNRINYIITLIADDIGVAFIFSIYLIIKTKRYLPKLWDDSRQIIGENNDFFSINPATVSPPNQQTGETSF